MRYSWLVALALAVAACQPVPRAFERAPGETNALLRLDDTRGIVVLPVADAPPATARGLAEGMVASLLDRGIPAYVGTGNRTSLFLVGEVIDPGRDAHIAWTLYDPEGAVVGRYKLTIEGTPIDLWAAADPQLMAALSDRAAARIAPFVQHAVAAEVTPPPIFVAGVRGAPTARGKSLEAALRQSLRRLGARVAAEETEETLVAAATLTLTELAGAQTEIAISWSVSDPNGTEIGRIDQSSPFSTELVRTRWPALAVEAGLAAAAGIIEMVSRIDWRDGFVPPPDTRVPLNAG